MICWCGNWYQYICNVFLRGAPLFAHHRSTPTTGGVGKQVLKKVIKRMGTLNIFAVRLEKTDFLWSTAVRLGERSILFSRIRTDVRMCRSIANRVLPPG